MRNVYMHVLLYRQLGLECISISTGVWLGVVKPASGMAC
jgi:hypothetical protein